MSRRHYEMDTSWEPVPFTATMNAVPVSATETVLFSKQHLKYTQKYDL